LGAQCSALDTFAKPFSKQFGEKVKKKGRGS
jgi:hypothetical protein